MSITTDYTVFFGKRIPFLQRGSIVYDNEQKMLGVCLGFEQKSEEEKEILICWEDATVQKIPEEQRGTIDLLGLRIDDASLKTFDSVQDKDSSYSEVVKWIHQAFSVLKSDLHTTADLVLELRTKKIF